MKVNNYLVTYTDLTTMGLTPIGTPPTGNQIATKQFIVNNYYVDQSVSPFSTYSSTRCPIYQSIVPSSPLPYSYTLYYDYNDTLPRVIGFTVPEDACTATNSFTVYSNSSSISIGTVLYYDLYGTIQIQANPNSTPSQNYYSIDNNIIQFSDNCTVGSISACAPPTTTTTTTAGPVIYTIDSFGQVSSFDACNYSNPSVSVYASYVYNVPMVGMIFYDSPSLTTPYVGGAGWRKFTNGVTNYAGEVDVNGELTNYVTC